MDLTTFYREKKIAKPIVKHIVFYAKWVLVLKLPMKKFYISFILVIWSIFCNLDLVNTTDRIETEAHLIGLYLETRPRVFFY